MILRLKDYNTSDTIAAIATFPSSAALGIIKISGKKSFSILSRIFLARKNKDLRKVKTYTLHYGWIIERPQAAGCKPQDIIDEVLVSVMRAPNSYTKEDVIEISCHGGVLVLNKILEIILKQGARLAQPGEFTYRAFLNGRIDLLQAESILSIVEAKSEQSLALANTQLKGQLSAKIREIKNTIKDIFVETEAQINFPEEELRINLSSIKTRLNLAQKGLASLLEGGAEAAILREGLRCVICGKTNVGKSTLFNCLLGKERVIVSRLPGTTRDVIEETINIRGVLLRIYDTAGILTPKDLVGRKAIEKSQDIFSQADLVILVLDGSRRLSREDLFFFNKLEETKSKDKTKAKKVIIVINKADLKQRINLKNITGSSYHKVKLSALTKKGIASLERAVFELVYKKGIRKEDMVFLGQQQTQVLRKALESVTGARNYLEAGCGIDFVNLALNDALGGLGKITGEVFSREIIENIFSNFCIGK